MIKHEKYLAHAHAHTLSWGLINVATVALAAENKQAKIPWLE
jgi:hypothetical protein